MAYDKSFDELLNDTLTDYTNQDPTIDTSKGSLVFIKSAAVSSGQWGLYQKVNYVANQIIPGVNTDRENLEHHATVRGLPLINGESDAALLARILEFIRRPPAGGNQYDYVRWAKEIVGVASAWCVSCGQGPGTVDVVVLSDVALTGSEIPTDQLLADVRAHLVDICPATIQLLRTLAPVILPQDVTITRTGADYPAAVAMADITAYLQSFQPGQVLYLAQLTSLALGGGAGDASCTTPANTVTPTQYQMLRPGVINVA